LDAGVREIAGWVEYNSVTRGAVTMEQAAGIDWVGIVVKAVARVDT
jgi:hypothetical protein